MKTSIINLLSANEPNFYDTDSFTINGVNMNVTCRMKDPLSKYDLNFALNGRQIIKDENHIITKFRHGENTEETLTIINTTKSRDEGNYTCIAFDQLDKITKSVTKYLEFLDKPGVIFTTNDTDIETHVYKKLVQYVISFKAYPMPSFVILDFNNATVFAINVNMNKNKYDVRFLVYNILFGIKTPHMEDFGKYTFIAICGGKNYTLILNLIVNKKPTVSVQNIFTRSTKPVSLTCTVISYPKAFIFWGT